MLKIIPSVLKWVPLFISLWFLAGCEGNSKLFTNTVEASKHGTVSIELTANNPAVKPIIEVKQTMTFTVVAINKAGERLTLDNNEMNDWSLACSAAGCATLDRHGVLTGQGDGTATVTVNYAGFIADAEVVVSTAKLTRIQVSRITSGTTIDYCRSYALKAEGLYDDNTTRVITDLATWKASTGGQVLKGTDGTISFSTSVINPVTITATHASFNSTPIDGDADFTANGDAPTLTIIPAGVTRVFTGQTKQFSANASWVTSGGSADVTKNASWVSSDSKSLDFTGNTTSIVVSQRQDGLATGKAIGTSTITAACGTQANATKVVNVDKLEVTGIRIFKTGDIYDYDTVGQYKISTQSVATFRAVPVYASGAEPDASQDITFQSSWSAFSGETADVIVGNSVDETAAEGTRKGDIQGKSVTTTDGYVVIKVIYDVPNNNGYKPETTFQLKVE